MEIIRSRGAAEAAVFRDFVIGVIVYGEIVTGSGNDSIKGTASGSGFSYVYGLVAHGDINTGSGKDTVIGSAVNTGTV